MRISDWSSDVCSSDLSISGSNATTWSSRSTSCLQNIMARRLEMLLLRLKLVETAARTLRSPETSASFRPLMKWPTASYRKHISRTDAGCRSEEHKSELQSLMRISYAVFCLKKKKNNQ